MSEAASGKTKPKEIATARHQALLAALRSDGEDSPLAPKGTFRDPAEALRGKRKS